MVPSKQLKYIRELIQDAEKVIIGAGAGMSASAGLDYTDESFFLKHYKPFIIEGYRTVMDAISDHWEVSEENAKSYWAFWAWHINKIYYEVTIRSTYTLLYDIIKDKDYFVITTNGDGRFLNNLFDNNRIYAMQGNYGQFQCQQGCHNQLYDNKEMINDLVTAMDFELLEVPHELIPRCPKCKGLMMPHLRIDHHFIETEQVIQSKAYTKFINNAYNHKSVYLELGVGYNTPSIIRYPFEDMVYDDEETQLVRINTEHPEIPSEINHRAVGINCDINELLKELKGN